MSAIVDVLPFALAAVITAMLSRRRLALVRRPRIGWMTVAAILAVVLNSLIWRGLPFRGLLSEIAVGLAATGTLVLVMRVIFLDLQPKTSARRLWPSVCMFVLAVIVMVQWTYRAGYSERLAWTCDGTIISKFRSSNHNQAALTVETADGPVTLDGVEESLWQEARESQRLVKPKGSTFGELDGKRVRVVHRSVEWLNEP